MVFRAPGARPPTKVAAPVVGRRRRQGGGGNNDTFWAGDPARAAAFVAIVVPIAALCAWTGCLMRRQSSCWGDRGTAYHRVIQQYSAFQRARSSAADPERSSALRSGLRAPAATGGVGRTTESRPESRYLSVRPPRPVRPALARPPAVRGAPSRCAYGIPPVTTCQALVNGERRPLTPPPHPPPRRSGHGGSGRGTRLCRLGRSRRGGWRGSRARG